MKCNKCGKEFTEGSFCPFCGQEISNEKDAKTVADSVGNKKTTSSSKIIVITVVGIALIIIVAVIVVLTVINRPVNKILKCINSESFDQAVSCYNQNEDKLDTKDKNRVLEEAAMAIDRIFNDYYAGDIEYEIALHQLDSLMQIDIVTSKANDAVETINDINTSRLEYAAAENSFSVGEYLTAILHYKNVIIADQENYNNSIEKMDECVKLYRDSVMSEAKEFEENKEYEKAYEIVKGGLENLKDDVELTSYAEELGRTIEEIKDEALSDEVSSLLNNGEFEQAIILIKDYTGTNETILALKEEAETAYASSIAEQVYSYIDVGEIDNAKKLLQDSNVLVEGNTIISDLLNSIDEYYPVSLTDLNIFLNETPDGVRLDGNWSSNYSDNMGNTYENGLRFTNSGYFGKDGFDDTGYTELTYVLESKYDEFTGKFVLKKETISPYKKGKAYAVLTIYGDGVSLYTSAAIKEGAYPVEFNVNISGVNELKIRVYTVCEMEVGVVEPQLRKTAR